MVQGGRADWTRGAAGNVTFPLIRSPGSALPPGLTIQEPTEPAGLPQLIRGGSGGLIVRVGGEGIAQRVPREAAMQVPLIEDVREQRERGGLDHYFTSIRSMSGFAARNASHSSSSSRLP